MSLFQESQQLQQSNVDIKYDTSSKNKSFEIGVSIVIAIIFAFFMSLLIDKIINYDEYCDYSDKSKACVEESVYNQQKFSYMIGIGILGIFGGAALSRIDKQYEMGGMGISIGGFLVTIYYTTKNWYHLDKNVQIIVLGGALLALIYGSIRIAY